MFNSVTELNPMNNINENDMLEKYDYLVLNQYS